MIPAGRQYREGKLRARIVGGSGWYEGDPKKPLGLDLELTLWPGGRAEWWRGHGAAFPTERGLATCFRVHRFRAHGFRAHGFGRIMLAAPHNDRALQSTFRCQRNLPNPLISAPPGTIREADFPGRSAISKAGD